MYLFYMYIFTLHPELKALVLLFLEVKNEGPRKQSHIK